MTAIEYLQLKAFARIDGLWVALLWIFSFLFYLLGLSRPTYGMMAMLMALATPFVLGFLLRKFRNGVLDGVISFGRGWGYSVLTCFYASLLFGLSVYAYFTFLDQGYLFDALAQMLQRADMAPVLKQGNLGTLLTDSLQQMKTMRPIDLALNMMFSCLMIGMLLALPIAALLQKAVRTT